MKSKVGKIIKLTLKMDTLHNFLTCIERESGPRRSAYIHNMYFHIFEANLQDTLGTRVIADQIKGLEAQGEDMLFWKAKLVKLDYVPNKLANLASQTNHLNNAPDAEMYKKLCVIVSNPQLFMIKSGLREAVLVLIEYHKNTFLKQGFNVQELRQIMEGQEVTQAYVEESSESSDEEEIVDCELLSSESSEYEEYPRRKRQISDDESSEYEEYETEEEYEEYETEDEDFRRLKEEKVNDYIKNLDLDRFLNAFGEFDYTDPITMKLVAPEANYRALVAASVNDLVTLRSLNMIYSYCCDHIADDRNIEDEWCKFMRYSGLPLSFTIETFMLNNPLNIHAIVKSRNLLDFICINLGPSNEGPVVKVFDDYLAYCYDECGATEPEVLPEFKGLVHDVDRMLYWMSDRGIGVNVRDHNGETLLMHAVRWRQDEAVIRLLQLGADTNIQNSYGKTVLHMTSGNRHQNVWSYVPLLIQHGANVNIRSNSGQAPMYYAIRRDAYTTVKALREHCEFNIFANWRMLPKLSTKMIQCLW